MPERLRADLSLSEVARLLGMKVDDLLPHMKDLQENRGFPSPEPLTGRFDPEAIERWRRLRNSALFPELEKPKLAKQSGSIDSIRKRLEAAL